MPVLSIKKLNVPKANYTFNEFVSEMSDWTITTDKTEDFLKAILPFIPNKYWGKKNSFVLDDMHEGNTVYILTRELNKNSAVKGKK
jgi:hypothetical protein